MKRSRRMALVAAVLVLGLAACGDPDGPTSGGSPSTDRGPAVIHVAPPAGKVAAGAPVASGDASESMMVAAIHYTLNGELPAFDGDAASWFFRPGAEPSAERVQALAAAFGITGDVETVPEDQGGGWVVGSTDYTGPSVTVSKSSMLDWWYSPGPQAASIAVAGCAVAPAPASDSVTGLPTEPVTAPPSEPGSEADAVTEPAPAPCPEPQPPANVPTAEAAEAAARDLFTTAGLDLSGYEFETTADEWGAYVSAFLVLDGHRSPVSVSVGFGADSTVTWASGALATPERGDDYPRIGTQAGFEALQNQATEWRSTSDAAGVKDALPASSGTVLPETVPPSDLPPITLPPIDTVEPIEVVLTGVKEDLTMVWASDNTVWLMPAYTFTSDDGGMYTVLAIDDSYVQTDEQPVQSGGSDPVEISQEATDTLVDLTAAEAETVATANGWTFRVVEIDGVPQPATLDYSPNRVNVGVAGGLVVSVTVG